MLSRTTILIAGLCVAILSLCIFGIFAAPVFAVSAGVNLVVDPGFESSPTKWPLPKDLGNAKWSIDTAVKHSGSNSLKLHNPDDSSYYLYPMHNVPVAAGCKFKVSVWIKTVNLKGLASGGACITLQWYDAAGKWIGGVYPSGIQGNKDWTYISTTTSFVPKNAATMKISPVVQKGFTGTAYYDDFSVEIVDDVSFISMIRSPNYKHRLLPAVSDNVQVGVDMMDNPVHFYGNLNIVASITRYDGVLVSNVQSWKPKSDGLHTIRFTISPLKPGEYRVNVKLFDKTRESVLRHDILLFTIAQPDAPTPKVSFDENNRCIIDGEVFFPIGCYALQTRQTQQQLPLISSIGFNCVLDYGMLYRNPLADISGYLDDMHRNGLKTIFCLVDCFDGIRDSYGEWNSSFDIFKGMVSQFKDHPSILAWYINDEKLGTYLPQIRQHYEYLQAADKDHPAFQVMSTANDAYATINHTDVIGVDDYPVLAMSRQNQSSPNLSTVFKEARDTAKISMASRALWMVPECSSQYSYGSKRPPSYQEILCETYQCIIGGARGIIFYNWTDLVADGEAQLESMRKVIAHINQIKFIALGDDLQWLKRVSSSNANVYALTRAVGDEIWVLAVNPTQSSQSVVFTVPAQLGSKSSVVSGMPGSTTTSISIENSAFADNIEKNGTRIYKLLP